VAQGNRMSMADPGARRPRKASQLVQGNRMDPADQVARKVLAGQATLPWNVDRISRLGTVDRANRVDTADQLVQMGRKALVGQARLRTSKEVSLTPTEDLHQSQRSISSSSSRSISSPRRARSGIPQWPSLTAPRCASRCRLSDYAPALT
jgi:hypothetical protein